MNERSLTQVEQLQSGKHGHNFELAWACAFHSTDEYMQTKQSNDMLLNLFAVKMQTPGITREILAYPMCDPYSIQHMWCLQIWACRAEVYTMDDKQYPFLLYCFNNSNTTVLVKPPMNQMRSSFHPQYHELAHQQPGSTLNECKAVHVLYFKRLHWILQVLIIDSINVFLISFLKHLPVRLGSKPANKGQTFGFCLNSCDSC